MKKKFILFTVIFIVAIIFVLLPFKGKIKQVENINEYAKEIQSIKVPDNTRIVGLGEATHGNVEFQNLKKEVFKALVKNNGCKVFAIEGDFGGGQKVNNYVLNGSGTAKKAVEEIGFGIYRTKEMVDLVQWIHDYNKNVNESDKIRFYGFDMQRYDNNKEGLFSYYEKVNSSLVDKYKNLLRNLNDKTVYDQQADKVKEGLKGIENLISDMEENKAKYIKSSSEKEYILALQFAQSIKENATLRGADINYSHVRDKYMANKIKWILEYEKGNMIFINGHNGHIDKSSAVGAYTSIGKYLADQFGNSYYAIGTDFNKSTFSAVTRKDKDKTFTIKKSNPLVDQFINLPENEYFMDFKKAKTNPYLKKIIEEKQPMGNVGSDFNSWQKISKKFYTLNMVPSKAYDGIIVVKNATATEKLKD